MDHDRLQRLLDESDCHALLARYGRAVDWRDRATLERIFWPDADVDLGFFRGKGADTPAFLIANANQSLRRCHITTSTDLRLEGDVAFADSCAVTHAVTGAPGADMAAHLFFGRYLDRLERRSAEWRIASRLYLLNGAVTEPYAEAGVLAAVTKTDDLGPEHRLFHRA